MKKLRRSHTSLFVAMCSLALSLFSTAMFAATASSNGRRVVSAGPRITQAIDERTYVPLSGNTRPEARNFANYRGPAAAELPIDHMFLFLQRSPEQEQAVDQFINSLNDRKSPNFHQWLTPEEYGERFGVAEEDIQQVTNWLQSHGFVINQVYPNRMLIDFSGTAGQIADAFHTQIAQLEVNGQAHLANISDPQIPEALAPVVKGIESLNDFKPHPMYKSRTQYTFGGCADTSFPTEPGTNCYVITPQDNQTIYNLNPLYVAGYSGQGQTIALVEDTDTYGTAGSGGKSDWNTYRSTFGLSNNFPLGSYSQVHPGCTDPGTNGDDGEAAIDVEVASAIAPSAAIELISCAGGTFTFGGQIALQNLINAAGPYPGVVSVSYGECEVLTGTAGNAAFYTTYQQAAAQGISVFVSSGDEGPSSCSNEFSPGSQYDVASLGVTGWGQTPYNVSVGGTDFEDTYNVKEAGASFNTYWSGTNTQYYGSALQYVPEIPWNDACASVLISDVLTNSFVPYGASPATCNNASWDTSSTYLSTGAGSGGASNCATGAAGTNQSSTLLSAPECQGYAKPSYQSGATLNGGQAVYGQPSDGVRDIPDVAMFAANGVWGHYEVVCWSDPAYTADGSAPCTGVPSTWAGFGGTSVASPTMAAVQALINQVTAENWGNPNPVYYQIGQNEYGTAGGSFQGTSCNSSGAGGPAAGCAFNDVTQGDINLACEDNGTTEEAHCYKPAGTYGVDSTDNVTAATVLNGGTGYTSAPTCTIAGPTNNQPYYSPTGTQLWAGGTQATCTAAVLPGSTNAVWTVAITTSSRSAPSASWAGAGITVGATTYTFVTTLGSVPNSVLLVTSGTGTVKATDLAKNLEAAVNDNSAQCTAAPCFANLSGANASATAAETTNTVTLTAINGGYAGNFNVAWAGNFISGPDYITITNTILGQGPNYVSGITIVAAGSGYQPETPITLTGGGGTGAIAVANTSIGTASSSYQPAYGAAPGYDLATGLGTPNATYLVSACAWLPSTSPGIFGPVPGSTLTGSSAAFLWYPNSSATNYWLDVGSTPGGNNYEQSGPLSANGCGLAVNGLPTNGSTVYVTWWYEIGGSWAYLQYQYTAAGSQLGVITTPTPGSTLSGSSQQFTWTAGTGATNYWLDAGSTPGGGQYYSSGALAGTVLTATATNLPTNGSTVYVTLFSYEGGQWLNNQYTYTAYNPSSGQGVLTTPTPGSTFTGSTVTFDWTSGAGASAYWMDVGSTSGGDQYYQSGNLGNVNTVTVNGLPANGSTVYVTLYSLIGAQWYGTTYTYTAYSLSNALAAMQTPVPGTEIDGTQATFTWSAGNNASGYWLDIGSMQGGNDIYQSGNLGPAQMATVSGLPNNGSEIYATLWTLVNGNWYYNQYNYQSGSGGTRPAGQKQLLRR